MNQTQTVATVATVDNVVIPVLRENSEFSETCKDFYHGIKDWNFWWSLSLSEIKRRYQRTMFGPFWTTLSLGVFIGMIGTMFSVLWKMNIKEFLPYFTSGYICWIFISTIINESCSTYISHESLLKNLPLNYTSFAWHLVSRNILVLAHHSIIYILVVVFLSVPVNLNIFLLIPGLILIILTGVSVSIILGLLSARYRDIQQAVSSVLQISLFCTPILWSAEQFNGTKLELLIQANPLFHYIKIIRDPLIGQVPGTFTWIAASSFTLIFISAALYTYSRYNKKLIYWL